MVRKSFLAVILGVFIITPLAAPLAQDAPKNANPNLIKRPEAIIPEGQVVDVDMKSEKEGFGPFFGTFTVKVLASGKGAKEGQTLSVYFKGGGLSACSFRAPVAGEIRHNLMLFRFGDALREATCWLNETPIYPAQDSLAAYRRHWLDLDAKAAAEPQNFTAQMALGAYLNAWRDKHGALAAYQRALERAPNDKTARLKVAALQIELTRFKAAQETLDHFQETDGVVARIALLRLQIAAIENQEREHAETEKRNQEGGFDHQLKRWEGYFLSAQSPALVAQDMSDFELSWLNLIDMQAAHSNWQRARLYQSTLRSADLTAANLSEAVFRNTDLTGTNLSQAQAKKAVIVDSVLIGISAEGLQGDDIDFSGSNLSGADLRNAQLRKANFDGTDLSGVNFEGADLREASFQIVKVDCKTRFPKGFDTKARQWIATETCDGRYTRNFDGIHFNVPAWENGKLMTDVLRKITFAGLDMRGASFRETHFAYLASFRKADIRHVDFSGAKFNYADFSQAIAQDARLTNVEGDIEKLVGVDFSGSVISGNPAEKPFKSTREKPFELVNKGGFPRLTGARIKNVAISFPDWPDTDDNRQNLLSFLDATIENSILYCPLSKPRPVSSDASAPDGKEAWSRYILTLDVVRKIVARNPTNRADELCTNAIARYLTKTCTTGRKEAGFDYACPPRL